MRFKTVICFISLSLLPFFVNAQFTIRGKIFVAESKEALPFVPVLIKGTTIGIQTDFDGNYTLKTSTLGDSLIASYVGYKRMARAINKKLQDQEINFPLVSDEGISLDEVTVKAGENPAHRIIRN